MAATRRSRSTAATGRPATFIAASNEPEAIERIKGDHPSALLIKPILPGRQARWRTPSTGP